MFELYLIVSLLAFAGILWWITDEEDERDVIITSAVISFGLAFTWPVSFTVFVVYFVYKFLVDLKERYDARG